MRVQILYRPNSEHDSLIKDFIRTYHSKESKDIELLDVDSPKGDEIAKLYDIVQYPAILVLRNDGQLQKMWQGSDLPLADEVISNANV